MNIQERINALECKSFVNWKNLDTLYDIEQNHSIKTNISLIREEIKKLEVERNKLELERFLYEHLN